jgi:hypothetical protein
MLSWERRSCLYTLEAFLLFPPVSPLLSPSFSFSPLILISRRHFEALVRLFLASVLTQDMLRAILQLTVAHRDQLSPFKRFLSRLSLVSRRLRLFLNSFCLSTISQQRPQHPLRLILTSGSSRVPSPPLSYYRSLALRQNSLASSHCRRSTAYSRLARVLSLF